MLPDLWCFFLFFLALFSAGVFVFWAKVSGEIASTNASANKAFFIFALSLRALPASDPIMTCRPEAPG